MARHAFEPPEALPHGRVSSSIPSPGRPTSKSALLRGCQLLVRLDVGCCTPLDPSRPATPHHMVRYLVRTFSVPHRWVLCVDSCKLRCATTQAHCSSGRKRQQGPHGHQPVHEANPFPKRFKAASAASELECLQSSAVRLLRAAHCKPRTTSPTPAPCGAARAPFKQASDTQPGSALHLAQPAQPVMPYKCTRPAHVQQRRAERCSCTFKCERRRNSCTSTSTEASATAQMLLAGAPAASSSTRQASHSAHMAL